MSYTPRFINTICHSCRKQLRLPFRTRAFVTTSSPRKTVPSFTPTANDELDSILLSLRQIYFQPHALSKHHRDLIYKPKHHQILLNDPGVTVTMSDGEEVRLMPTNPTERPPKDKSLTRLKELLQNSDNASYWDNLVPLMEGFQMSRERFPPGWLEQIVRKAHEKHQTGIIIQCARQVKATGFSLANARVTRELFLGLHRMAAHAEFKGSLLQQASKWTEQIVLMMEDRLHCGGKLALRQTDMRRDVLVMATYLEINAAEALESGQDADGKAESLVRRLMALWKTEPPRSMDRLEHEMERDIVLLHAMQLALKVDSIAQSDMATDLKSKVQGLEKKVLEAREKVLVAADGKKRRCLQMYEAVYGK